MEEKCISKIRIESNDYDIKDEGLRKGIEGLIEPIESYSEELNDQAKID